MTTKRSLHSRLEEKARPAVRFSKITKTDVHGRAITVVIPGSEAKQYEVIIRRYMEKGTPVITTECRCKTGIGFVTCPSNNGKGEICYHSCAALLKSVEDKNTKISFCASEDAAKNLQHLGGIVVKIRSHQGTGELWAVAK